MKKTLYIIASALLLTLTACDEFTDITPKGKNMLETTDQLELLLNGDLGYNSYYDFAQMTGDILYAYSPVASTINAEKKSKNSIVWTWDEDMDKLAELTTSDYTYSDAYNMIGAIANPILSRLEEAEGTEAKKNQLKAEALTLRAANLYFLVNKFAKAYNPSTAASEDAIPVYLEDDDISESAPMWTVQQVYDQIVADADAAEALKALPAENINRSRVNNACPMAVKAMALLAMQDYDGAESAAKASLAYNSAVTDYNSEEYTYYMEGVMYPMFGLPAMTYPTINRKLYACKEDNWQTVSMLMLESISPEAEARFEPGHAVQDRVATIDLMYDNMMKGSSLMGTGLEWRCAYDMMSGESYWNNYGFKTTHMYLIVAECEIEKGNFDAAMEALDAIRVCRINPAVYAPLKGTVSNKADAIAHLKQTSHGENIFSIYNFINRKRWNQISDYKETFTKDLFGTIYTLTPDSKLWVFPFPTNAFMNENVHHNY